MKSSFSVIVPFVVAIAMFTAVATNNSSVMKQDGPYVSYKNNQIYVTSVKVEGENRSIITDSFPENSRNNITLKVHTDIEGSTFSFGLKEKLENEKAEYKKISKQFVMSDIEGNFAALRKMLQANNIIDKDFNWTFGDGHLVLVGDFVDRGEQVTEVLWLIYSLEDKAKAAGGYVHYILGNHELMVMSGDLRYVNVKYVQNAAMMGESVVSLYAANTELGRWLRTKNIAEKVGDVLFTHGGISDYMNQLAIPVNKLNELARPFYSDTSSKFTDNRLDYIYSDIGPFWYRGYYSKTNPLSPGQVDSTLDIYSVRHITTGHSLVADTVSTWYKGKVINTDTHHASGKSEALYIEGRKFYRTNAMGEKKLLFER